MSLREFFWVDNYLFILGVYLAIFLIMPYVVNKKWYKQNPREEFDDQRLKNELIKNSLEHNKFLESTSYVLSGSALIGLTFIITSNYDDMNVLEPAITFFSIAFVLECISAIAFHDIRINFWGASWSSSTVCWNNINSHGF